MITSSNENMERLLNTICNRRQYTTEDLTAAAEKIFKDLWALSTEEMDPDKIKAIQTQASKIALTYFIAMTRNWMDDVEANLDSKRGRGERYEGQLRD